MSKWAIEILCYVSEEDLIKVDKNKGLSGFINKAKMQIMISDKLIDHFVKSALAIDIKLIDIRSYHKENNLFPQIIDNNLYEISMKNINHILKEVYGENLKVEMKTKNFTVLRRHLDTSLYEYIQGNMEIYIGALLKEVEEINDDYDTVIELFKQDNISDNLKQEYVKKLITPIISINDIIYPFIVSKSSHFKLVLNILLKSIIDILPFISKEPLPKFTILLLSMSYSSSMSPTISSIISSIVTIPEKPPYSSIKMDI